MLRKTDHLTTFLTGLGIGVAVLLLVVLKARGNTGKGVGVAARGPVESLDEQGGKPNESATGVSSKRHLSGQQREHQRRQILSHLKDKAEHMVDGAQTA